MRGRYHRGAVTTARAARTTWANHRIDDAHDLVLVSDGARFIPFGAPWTGWPFDTLP